MGFDGGSVPYANPQRPCVPCRIAAVCSRLQYRCMCRAAVSLCVPWYVMCCSGAASAILC